MRSAGFLSLLVGCVGLAGCGATAGQDWLNSPLDEQARLQTRASSDAADSDLAVALPAESEARPRLRHSITLGESYDVASPAAAAAAPAWQSVHVNVQTYVPVTVNNYGVVSARDLAPAPPAISPSSPPQAGQDFPAPTSYGPSFPFHGGPASPWTR